jgi:hypothetical protein
MMWKLKGRAALLTCASLVAGLGLTSCGTSTLGYIYVTSVQYGQVFSFHLDQNTGKIGGPNCNPSNGGQQVCNNSTGGSTPTKMVFAQGGNFMYVLNLGTTSPVSAGNVALFTLGGSGTVYSTGQTFTSSGQNPVDMVLAANGGYLYVLDQYQPTNSPYSDCANPTPTTCSGDITVFQIGSNGNLVVQNDATPPSLPSDPTYVPPYYPLTNGALVPPAPIGNYGGNHFYSASNILYVLDNSSSNVPQVDSYTVNSATAALTNSQNVATFNSAFVQPFAITGSGGNVFISDLVTGAIWTYSPTGSNGALGLPNNGYFCPANPAQTTTTGGAPTQSNCAVANPGVPLSSAVQLDTMLPSSVGTNPLLYAADFNTGNVYSMNVLSTTGGVLTLSKGGPNPVAMGANPTCMVISSGTPFLYTSGNGTIVGEQIDTSTGVLTTENNPITTAAVQGYDPCILFSSRH